METINSFRTDNGETVFEDAGTKEMLIAKAREHIRGKYINVWYIREINWGIDGL
jgi:hypothetical protein